MEDLEYLSTGTYLCKGGMAKFNSNGTRTISPTSQSDIDKQNQRIFMTGITVLGSGNYVVAHSIFHTQCIVMRCCCALFCDLCLDAGEDVFAYTQICKHIRITYPHLCGVSA